MKTTEEIEKRIRELVPELMEETDGLEVKVFVNGNFEGVSKIRKYENITKQYYLYNYPIHTFKKDDLEIIGHPIELQSILKAISMRIDAEDDDLMQEYIQEVFEYYDLTKTVRQNLDDNAELRKLLAKLLF